MGVFAGDGVLEATATLPELVGLAGVCARTGFLGDLVASLAGEVGVAAEGRMLFRLPVVELVCFAGVLGRAGMVLVRLPEVAVEVFPRTLPGLAVVVLGALAGVLGFALVELTVLAVLGLVVELGVGDREGRDEGRRGALRRSTSAACCCCLRALSMSLRRGACDRRGRRSEYWLLSAEKGKHANGINLAGDQTAISPSLALNNARGGASSDDTAGLGAVRHQACKSRDN